MMVSVADLIHACGAHQRFEKSHLLDVWNIVTIVPIVSVDEIIKQNKTKQ
jgi:hypothetical protein